MAPMKTGILPTLTAVEREALRRRLADWKRHRDNLARDYAKLVALDRDDLSAVFSEFSLFDTGIRALRIALGDEE